MSSSPPLRAARAATCTYACITATMRITSSRRCSRRWPGRVARRFASTRASPGCRRRRVHWAAEASAEVPSADLDVDVVVVVDFDVNRDLDLDATFDVNV